MSEEVITPIDERPCWDGMCGGIMYPAAGTDLVPKGWQCVLCKCRQGFTEIETITLTLAGVI